MKGHASRPAHRLNLLGSYGAWAESLSSENGELSFRRTVAGGSMSLEEWKRQGRARVRELVGPLPTEAAATDPASSAAVRAESSVRTVKSIRRAGLDIEELSWQLPYGPPTRAVFMKPAGARGPLPGVLALHDHGLMKASGADKIADTDGTVHPFVREHRGRFYGGVAWANELALRGFGVLAHDVFPFGSRRILATEVPAHAVEHALADPARLPPLTVENTAAGRHVSGVDALAGGRPAERERYEAFADGHEDVVARSLFALGLSFPGVTLAEDLVALRVLAGRQELDQARLGCCGLSGGGLRAVFLAGLTDAITCAVTAGFMSTWKDFALYNGYLHTWALFVPRLARWLDFPEILGLRAPLPTLVLSCDGDLLFDQPEVVSADAMLGMIYREAGAPDHARTSHHPYPHCFNRPMQEEAFDWLRHWLTP